MELNNIVSFKLDKRIFTLFCGLHATKASYFKKISDKKLSPVGKEVKFFLVQRKFRPIQKLKKFLDRQHPYHFIIWVLQHSSPPQFKKIYKKWGGELSLGWYKGFEKALCNFYFEANIEKLWRQHRESYQKEIKKYSKSILPFIQKLFNYLKIKKSPVKEIIFIPNLLDAIGAGYGPTIYNRAFVVFSPAKNGLNIQLLRHELLHSIINPLVQKWEIDEKKIGKKLLRKIATPTSLKYYNGFKIIISEYIIRAIELRLLPPHKRNQYIKNQIKSGFPYIEFFNSQLKKYERSEKCFSKYLKELYEELISKNKIYPQFSL